MRYSLIHYKKLNKIIAWRVRGKVAFNQGVAFEHERESSVVDNIIGMIVILCRGVDAHSLWFLLSIFVSMSNGPGETPRFRF